MAKKLKLALTPEDLPPQVAELEIGGPLPSKYRDVPLHKIRRRRAELELE